MTLIDDTVKKLFGPSTSEDPNSRDFMEEAFKDTDNICAAYFEQTPDSSINRPGVDELVDALGLAGDLRVALADVDHLRAGEHRQRVEAALGERTFDELRAVAGFLVLQQRRGDLGEGALGEVTDETRVGAVLEHR